VEEEIDLREIFLILWQKRKFIVGFTVILTLFSIIYALTLKKVYEAKSVIMITPSKVEFIKSPLDAASSFISDEKGGLKPIIPLNTHLQLLVSNAVLEEVSKEINKKYSPEELSGKLKPEVVKKTSLIELNVRDTDPVLAKDIADTWAKVYIEKSRKFISEETASSTNFMYKEYEDTRKKLEEKEKEYRDFLRNSEYDFVLNRYKVLKNKIAKYEKDLINKEDEIEVTKRGIESLNNEIKKHNRFITLSKAITDNALWQKVEKGDVLWDKLKNKKLETQVLNPVYQELEKKLADNHVKLERLNKEYEYIKNKYVKTKKEYEELEKKVNGLKEKKLAIERDIDFIKRKYNAIYSKITDALLVSKANLGDVKIVSFSNLPDSPVSPRKKRIVLITFFISFFVSLILSFVIHFFENLKV